MSDTAESQHSLSNRTKAQLVEELENVRRKIHQIEQERAQPKRLLDAILANAPSPISLRDLQGKYIFTNPAWRSPHYLSIGDTKGKDLGDFFSEKVVAPFNEHILEVIESGKAVAREVSFPHPDGVRSYISVKFPVRNAAGKIVSIGSITTDITERKQMENSLRQSEARFRDFAEGANDWIWEMDSDFRYTYISSSHEQYSGVPPGRVVGHTRGELYDQVMPNLEAHEVEHWQKFNRLLEARQSFRNFEQRWVRPDGEVRYFLTSAKPVFDVKERFVGYRGVGSDITDVKRRDTLLREELERQIEERTAELHAAQADLLRQERLATLGQLTATVSHELRNPLGSIRISAFILRDNLREDDPRIRRALERMERNVVRCDRIIEELLDFTRFSDIETEPTPLDDWLRNVLEEQALPSGVNLRRDLGLAGVAVLFDQDRFRRAVINVVDNACQAMLGEGDERAEPGKRVLTVRTRERHGRIEVIFSDTGPGIPPDDYENIFEPLFSTKGFGVGLGLPIVKQIMEQHGGGIEIETEEGRGTQVYLWLPSGHSNDQASPHADQ